jgi:septal ring factor EnvC (AmiA/AmiB activator)
VRSFFAYFFFLFLNMTEVVGVKVYNTGRAKLNMKERRDLMEDAQIVLERHEQRIRSIERDISDLKAVQTEIRTMNETLVTLATELKHTNEHLARHEQKIDAIEGQPKMRMQQIVTAIIAALAGGLISTCIGMILG